MFPWFRRNGRLSERFRKRPFVVAWITITCFTLAAVFIFISLGIFGELSEYQTVRVNATSTGIPAGGYGVNLSSIPSTNLVMDPSFENTYVEDVFTLQDAQDDYIYLKQSSNIPESMTNGFYSGGELRILSVDETGKMTEKLDAQILDYQVNQFGIWNLQEDTNGLYSNTNIVGFSSSDKITMALCENGTVISDILSTSPISISSDLTKDPIIDISASDGRYCAVTSCGVFYISSDGRTWSTITPEDDLSPQILAVSSIGKVGIACGEKGLVLTATSTGVVASNISTNEDLQTAVSDGTHIILAGKHGALFTSSNGTVFRELSSDELFSVNDNWVASSYSNGRFVLVGSLGQMAIGTWNDESESFQFTRHECLLGGTMTPEEISVFPTGEILLLDDLGTVYSFSESNDKWESVTAGETTNAGAFGVASGDRIVVSHENNVYFTSLFTKVKIDEIIAEDDVRDGDMCYLSAPVSSIGSDSRAADACVWNVYGENTTAQTVSDSPQATGQRALHLFGGANNGEAEDNPHFVSQVISRDNVIPMEEKTFYRIDVWLKQSNIEDDAVMVWLAGVGEPIGTTFSDVGGNWRQYSYVFAWPASVSQDTVSLTLNIGFYGSGDLYVDGVNLGRESYADPMIAPSLADAVATASPSYIRLDNLEIGMVGSHTDDVFLAVGNEPLMCNENGQTMNNVRSLEASLRLIKQSGANPWIVIDSSVGKEDIDALMGYLCGSISDPYGKLRIDNGTAVPWSRQFDRFVIEIRDDNGLFESDLQRGSYVDYVMSLFTDSLHYMDMKDRAVYLDGMIYSGGTMQSLADYHTSDFRMSNASLLAVDSESDLYSNVLQKMYLDYKDGIPRIISRPLDTSGEFISSSTVEMISETVSENQIILNQNEISAAMYVDFFLSDVGHYTSTMMVDLQMSSFSGDIESELLFSDDMLSEDNRAQQASNQMTMLRVMNKLGIIENARPTETTWAAPLKYNEDTPYTPLLSSYAFATDDNVYLVITNSTDSQQQFVIESDISLRYMTINRYSATGKKLNTTNPGNRTMRLTLQSGQYIIATIPKT
ncbi:MAG TPA: hypothetical protein PK567_01665 [Bacillota bacterium]|nr:hypothetical protein [Bacillota bacterium]